mmetsp:Transcript_45030/g.98405  ORF Transcript_45030/g.98405 Transcript_45030/m.98405 type:complete len:314 (-) Transcript_45030:681-1622(-)
MQLPQLLHGARVLGEEHWDAAHQHGVQDALALAGVALRLQAELRPGVDPVEPDRDARHLRRVLEEAEALGVVLRAHLPEDLSELLRVLEVLRVLVFARLHDQGHQVGPRPPPHPGRLLGEGGGPVHDARVRHREHGHLLHQGVAGRRVAEAHAHAGDVEELRRHGAVPPLLAGAHVLHADENVPLCRLRVQVDQMLQQVLAALRGLALELPALGHPLLVLLGGQPHGDDEDIRLFWILRHAPRVRQAVVDQIPEDVAAGNPRDTLLGLVVGAEGILFVEPRVRPLLGILPNPAACVRLRHGRILARLARVDRL